MKHSKFISVVIATLLLFCSADAFAQRSRGGKGSGGRTQGYSRSASKSSFSRSKSRNISYSSSSTKGCCMQSYESYRLSGEPIKSIAHRSFGVAKPTPKPTAVYFSTNDVLNSSCTNFGFEVSKRKATKESLLVSRQAGDFYYRDGIFFSPSKENGNKYEIQKPNSGLSVPVLPASSKVYEFEGVSYYYYYDTYYVFDKSRLEYVVVAPPVGLVVDLLPCDAQAVMVENSRYMITDNVLYKDVSSDKEVKYEVARLDKETMYLIKDYLASARRQQMLKDWNLYSEK